MKVSGYGEGVSLRNHREVVAAAWTDFEARLPDRYPPMLSALLAIEDGQEPGLETQPAAGVSPGVGRIASTGGGCPGPSTSKLGTVNDSCTDPGDCGIWATSKLCGLFCDKIGDLSSPCGIV